MLWFDDEFQALRQAIEQGKGYKATALHLWPGMKPDSAYARLKSCSNPSGDQKLGFREWVAVMKYNDRFEPLDYLCDETGHERPKRKNVLDEAAELQRAFVEAVSRQQQLIERMERLTKAPVMVFGKPRESA